LGEYAFGDLRVAGEGFDFTFVIFAEAETFHLIRLFGHVLLLALLRVRCTLASMTVLKTGNPFFIFNPASYEFR
jgi:hypothetical protein